MTKEEKECRAILDLYRACLNYYGMGHKFTVKTIAELCLGAITKQEALAHVFYLNEEETARISDKINELYCSKAVLDFVQDHWEILQIEEFTSTWSEYDTTRHVLEGGKPDAWQGESKMKVPVKDLYWVTKRLIKTMQNEGSKRYMYHLAEQQVPIEARRIFLKATQFTETNHRKKPQRYTVSRDEDRKVFYVSARGRLAQLPKYKLDKYMKQKFIVEDHGELRATCEIADGQYVKVGSYLEKHFKKVPKDVKEKLQKAFEEIRPCKMIIDDNFEIAYNPHYNNHQDTDGDKASNYSCMSGEGICAQQFYGKIHGCKVVRWETDRGDQVGRCIMYEYNGQRHFVRIYGVFDYHRTMINMLQNEMKDGDLFGRSYSIKDMVLDTDWDEETNTMYLDGPYGVKRVEEKDSNGNWKTKYKVVEHGYDFDCNTTSHETLEYEEDKYYTCDHCGERVHEDDVWWVRDNTYCCRDCAHNDGLYECEWCDEWEYEDDGIWVEDGEHFYCCSEHAESAGYRRCANCGKWHAKSGMLEIDDDYYCDEECADSAGWHSCGYCGDWCNDVNPDVVETEDGFYCDKDCAEKDGWTKDGDNWKRAESDEQVKEQEEPKEVSNEN